MEGAVGNDGMLQKDDDEGTLASMMIEAGSSWEYSRLDDDDGASRRSSEETMEEIRSSAGLHPPLLPSREGRTTGGGVRQ